MTRITAIFLLVFSGVLLANGLSPGAQLPTLAFDDQFGKHHTIDAHTRLLLFAPDHEASKLVDAALKGHDAAFLSQHGIVYLADISEMPGLITRFVALPKLQQHPYPILLGRDAGQTASLPRHPGAVTALRLSNGQVTSIQYLTTAENVTAAISENR
jgi:hypothetical protein